MRRFAPVAFRTQERAVTPDDYARMAERHPQVQRAAGTFRWTGSWRTVFVTADPLGGEGPRRSPSSPTWPCSWSATAWPATISRSTRRATCRWRSTCRCAPGATTSAPTSSSALLDVFSARDLPDGRRGVFHPDNFTFGQPVYLSRLYAAA